MQAQCQISTSLSVKSWVLTVIDTATMNGMQSIKFSVFSKISLSNWVREEYLLVKKGKILRNLSIFQLREKKHHKLLLYVFTFWQNTSSKCKSNTWKTIQYKTTKESGKREHTKSLWIKSRRLKLSSTSNRTPATQRWRSRISDRFRSFSPFWSYWFCRFSWDSRDRRWSAEERGSKTPETRWSSAPAGTLYRFGTSRKWERMSGRGWRRRHRSGINRFSGAWYRRKSKTCRCLRWKTFERAFSSILGSF